MSKSGGLGTLQVGVTGHNGVQIGLGLADEDLLQIQHHGNDLGDLLLGIQAGVHGNLIVAAAAGMQALAGGADALGQHGLDVHVDVLVVQRELHLIVLNINQNGFQTGNDLLGLVGFDDALIAQHTGMGDGAADILLIQAGIEADGRVKIVYQDVGFLLKPTGPEFHKYRSLYSANGE